MNRLKKELNVLKSWGINEISIDKILYMIDNIEEDSKEDDSEDNYYRKVFSPSEIKEEGVDKYFRYIPMYVNSNKSYPLYNEIYRTTGTPIPESDVWIY